MNYLELAKVLYVPDEAISGYYDEDLFYMYGFTSYEPIIEYIGSPTYIYKEDDYQGDTLVFYLLDEPEMYAKFLAFSWGSCSGCDALQGCDSYNDLGELIERLVESVRIFKTKEEAIAFFSDNEINDHYKYESYWETVCENILKLIVEKDVKSLVERCEIFVKERMENEKSIID